MEIPEKKPSILPLRSTPRDDDAKPKSPGETSSVQEAASGDRVKLSQQVRELHAARAAISQMPDIREEKVTAIRAQIEAGTYKVDSEKIAAKMIAEALFDTPPES